MKEQPFRVIGIIDNYGAIHYFKIYSGTSTDQQYHETHWPGRNRRWSFDRYDWNLQKSCLSCDGFTEAEQEDIIALMRKIINPPVWVIRNEIWEKHGRPRDGKAYKAYLRELKTKGIEE